MEWREVIEHPSLKDLPFKIETNEWGKIVMAPISYTRGVYQTKIAISLGRLEGGGKVSMGCPIQTSKGIKVADVAWRSRAFHEKHGVHNLFLVESPEIVVEIASPSNSTAELKEKMQLYFEAGAKEFWLCEESGNMRFFNSHGEMERSELFEEFPEYIDIDLPDNKQPETEEESGPSR